MRQKSNNIDSLSGSLLPDEKEQLRSEKKNNNNKKVYIYIHISQQLHHWNSERPSPFSFKLINWREKKSPLSLQNIKQSFKFGS